MPARRFFAMARAARKLRLRELIDQTEIAGVSICKGEYWQDLFRGYQDQLHFLTHPDERPDVLAARSVKAASDEELEAKTDVMKDRIRFFKQINGVSRG